MDDIYDLLETGEKPFQQPKAPEYKSSGFSGPKKQTLWDKTDIKPVKISLDTFQRTKKTFGVFLHTTREAIPSDMEERIVNFAKALFTKGYTFRYNGDKSDAVQLKIVDLPNAKVECYLPWKKFNEEFSSPVLMSPTEKAYGIAYDSHGAFMKMSPAVRAILSREIHVILGKECTEPLDLAIVYNLDGSEVVDKKTEFKKQGNTTFVLRVTESSDIPVFNIKNDASTNRLIEFIKNHS